MAAPQQINTDRVKQQLRGQSIVEVTYHGDINRSEQDEVNFCPACKNPVRRTSIVVNGRQTGAETLSCTECVATGTLHSNGHYKWTWEELRNA